MCRACALTRNWLFCESVTAAIFVEVQVGRLHKAYIIFKMLKRLGFGQRSDHRSAQPGTVVHAIAAHLQKGKVADLANFEVFLGAVESALEFGCKAAK
jgi:hypothetical protein